MILWTLFRNSLPLQLVALSLVGWAAIGANNLYQRNVGASRHAEKTEKANENATNLGKSAAAASADKRVRGRRDPTTRDD
jgi:hypothetical protein